LGPDRTEATALEGLRRNAGPRWGGFQTMTKRIHALATAAALATVVIGGNAFAAGVKLLTTIDIPGEELKLFDIGVVDAGRYYIADRSNKAVDIVDPKTNKYVGRI
jgi:hypothetical protein